MNWRKVWGHSLDEQQQAELPRVEKGVLCSECRRCFRRERDRARHKCIAGRRRPVREQTGAVQCVSCGRWFRSRGGLAVHRCRREEEPAPQAPGSETGAATASQGQVVCGECERTFGRQGYLKRHKCLTERRKPINEQRGAAQWTVCQKWFRSAGGLAIHRRVHTTLQS